VCMHVHDVRIQVHAYICMIVRAGICVCMHTFIFEYVYECIHICLKGHHVCMPMHCVLMRLHVHISVFARVGICVRVYVHIYTDTRCVCQYTV